MKFRVQDPFSCTIATPRNYGECWFPPCPGEGESACCEGCSENVAKNGVPPVTFMWQALGRDFDVQVGGWLGGWVGGWVGGVGRRVAITCSA